MSIEEDEGDTGLLTRTESQVREPALYQVVLLNDDYTPMDFVVQLVMTFFNKPEEEAIAIMWHVHHHGQGICGIFTREIAETKVMHVNRFSRSNGHPLRCKMEEV